VQHPRIVRVENAMNSNALQPRRDAHVTAGLWGWFACGCAAVLLVPGLRGRDPTFGWLGYWCVLAPLIDLTILQFARWLAASRTLLVRARRRYRPPRQARRVAQRRPQRSRRRALLTALFNP
jgi:hypothetical protein